MTTNTPAAEKSPTDHATGRANVGAKQRTTDARRQPRDGREPQAVADWSHHNFAGLGLGSHMAHLDRLLQRRILQSLRDSYPNSASARELGFQKDEPAWVFNASYLGEHGLIEATAPEFLNGGVQVLGARITAAGLDFIEDDGGLSAALGVVTIKLHDDTLKALIERRIQDSDLPQPDKKRWLDQLRSLPAETTKHLALKLVDLGLERGPAAIAAIGTALGL